MMVKTMVSTTNSRQTLPQPRSHLHKGEVRQEPPLFPTLINTNIALTNACFVHSGRGFVSRMFKQLHFSTICFCSLSSALICLPGVSTCFKICFSCLTMYQPGPLREKRKQLLGIKLEIKALETELKNMMAEKKIILDRQTDK